MFKLDTYFVKLVFFTSGHKNTVFLYFHFGLKQSIFTKFSKRLIDNKNKFLKDIQFCLKIKNNIQSENSLIDQNENGSFLIKNGEKIQSRITYNTRDLRGKEENEKNLVNLY